jgi:glycosyl transferase, family 25
MASGHGPCYIRSLPYCESTAGSPSEAEDKTITVNPIDRIIVLNLISRPDRRAEMSGELARIGWPEHQTTWYPAIDPREAAGFPNAGYRGCFLSHLAALNIARNAGYQAVLILEDDCDFGPDFAAVSAALGDADWGIAYLGHAEHPPVGPSPLVEWPPDSPVLLAHCYAVRGPVLPSLCAYLEAMLLRPAGSADGGPMSPDGALTWFRRAHPEVRTLLASPSVAGQRSSRSDLCPRPLDFVPGVRQAAETFRRWNRRSRSVPSK